MTAVARRPVAGNGLFGADALGGGPMTAVARPALAGDGPRSESRLFGGNSLGADRVLGADR